MKYLIDTYKRVYNKMSDRRLIHQYIFTVLNYGRTSSEEYIVLKDILKKSGIPDVDSNVIKKAYEEDYFNTEVSGRHSIDYTIEKVYPLNYCSRCGNIMYRNPNRFCEVCERNIASEMIEILIDILFGIEHTKNATLRKYVKEVEEVLKMYNIIRKKNGAICFINNDTTIESIKQEAMSNRAIIEIAIRYIRYLRKTT